MSKKISVLMPVYNGLPLIKASVESILGQTYKDWECVIVDDGSTDGTSVYLDSLSDSRFVIYHFSSNKGRPTARQKTLELSDGQYIAFLDAGDLYAKNTLEIMYNYMENNPSIALVSSSMCSFGTRTDLLRVRGVTVPVTYLFDGVRFPNFAASMLRAERAKIISFNATIRLGEDRDYLERYLTGQKYLEIPNILYYYSEFDSVSKAKIRLTYIIEMRKDIVKGRLLDFVKSFFKYCYSWIVYPFMSTTEIISKRGRIITEDEEKCYKADCKAIVDKALLQ